MKKMNSVWMLFLAASLLGVAQSKEHSPIKILVSTKEKDVCLMSLNQQLFLIKTKDIGLIKPSDISTIQVYNPNSELYKTYISKHKLKKRNIVSVIEVTTKPDAILPDKFTSQNLTK